MKSLLLGFALLLLSIWLGLEVSRSAGYVLITYRHWSVETSLWVALILLVFTFFLFYFALRLFSRTMHLSSQLGRWKRMRRYRKARYLTRRGVCELAEGFWKKAEATLLRAAKITKNPLINYLSAARAAQAQQAFDRRDDYFHQAHNHAKSSQAAIDLTQAELQIEAEQWDQALGTLKHLQLTHPNHPRALLLFKRIYLALSDWFALYDLLPQLKKQQVLSADGLDALEERVYCAYLNQTGSAGLDSLQQAWQKLSRRWQQHPAVVCAYTEQLVHHQEEASAIHVIEATLKKNWSDQLVKQYGLIQGVNPGKRLSKAEHWLKHHPKDLELLICLGRLSIQEKFWGKAKEYLEASLSIQPTIAAYRELGFVFLELGEQASALMAYQKALTVL